MPGSYPKESIQHTEHGESLKSRKLLTSTRRAQTKHKTHTSMHPAGFKPTVAANKRPQIHSLDRAATEIGISNDRE